MSGMTEAVQLIAQLGALGILAYLSVWGMPAAAREIRAMVTEMSQADRVNRGEIRTSFLEALQALEERHERSEEKCLEAVGRVGRALSRLAKEVARGGKEGGEGGADDGPRGT